MKEKNAVQKEINEGIEELNEHSFLDSDSDFYDEDFVFPKKENNVAWIVGTLAKIFSNNPSFASAYQKILHNLVFLHKHRFESKNEIKKLIKFAQNLKNWMDTSPYLSKMSYRRILLKFMVLYFQYGTVKKMQRDFKKRTKIINRDYLVPLYGREYFHGELIFKLLTSIDNLGEIDNEKIANSIHRNGRRNHLIHDIIPKKVEKNIRQSIANFYSIYEWHSSIKENVGIIRSLTYKYLESKGTKYGLHDINSIINVVKLFRERSDDYIKRMTTHGVSVHDCMSSEWSKIEKLTEDQIEWIFKIDPLHAQNAYTILNKWDLLTEKGWNHTKKDSYDNANLILSLLTYKNVKDENFAKESSKWKIDEQQFYLNENWWIESRKDLTYQSIPAPGGINGIKLDDYKIIQLHKDDVRVPYIGYYTGCCQHLGGYGATCARHSVKSPEGAVWVIEFKNSIIAQAWVWRTADILCLDNVEIGRVAECREHIEKIKELVILACKNVKDKLEISTIYIGTGYTMFQLPEYEIINFELKPDDYYGYSDAYRAWKIF